MGARGTPATALVAKAKVEHRIHEYHHDPAAPSYGLEAAERLGVDPATVFKTLLAHVDGRLAVAVVPVAARLDLKALAAAAGGRRAVMAEAPDAERATGYVVRRIRRRGGRGGGGGGPPPPAGGGLGRRRHAGLQGAARHPRHPQRARLGPDGHHADRPHRRRRPPRRLRVRRRRLPREAGQGGRPDRAGPPPPPDRDEPHLGPAPRQRRDLRRPPPPPRG